MCEREHVSSEKNYTFLTIANYSKSGIDTITRVYKVELKIYCSWFFASAVRCYATGCGCPISRATKNCVAVEALLKPLRFFRVASSENNKFRLLASNELSIDSQIPLDCRKFRLKGIPLDCMRFLLLHWGRSTNQTN